MRIFVVFAAFVYGSVAYAQQSIPPIQAKACAPASSRQSGDLRVTAEKLPKPGAAEPASPGPSSELANGDGAAKRADACLDETASVKAETGDKAEAGDKSDAGEKADQNAEGQPSQASQQQSNPPPGATNPPKQDTPAGTPAQKNIPTSEQQPKRILSIMPNYKAVSAGAIPPPPTPKEAFWIATENSFDYSSFIFVGLTSLIAKGTDAHPQLGKGFDGYGRYYWRGFVDKADGNYLVLFALPSLLHEDERYYAMGHAGGVWKRLAYSATRVLITPNYQGHNTFNFSEVLGRGAAQAISTQYYPAQDNTAGAVATRFGYAVLRDAATNMFREFWPDIAVHVLHRHP